MSNWVGIVCQAGGATFFKHVLFYPENTLGRKWLANRLKETTPPTVCAKIQKSIYRGDWSAIL